MLMEHVLVLVNQCIINLCNNVLQCIIDNKCKKNERPISKSRNQGKKKYEKHRN